jgi:hypothetical protein
LIDARAGSPLTRIAAQALHSYSCNYGVQLYICIIDEHRACPIALISTIHLRGGIIRSRLNQERSFDVDLLPPEDDFYEKADYEELFGDISDPVNRKAKHELFRHPSGKIGVLIPAEKGRPWKLQRRFGSGTKQVDTIHDDALDSDVDSEAADAKFEDLLSRLPIVV